MNKTASNLQWEKINATMPQSRKQRLRERYLRVYEALCLGLVYAEYDMMMLHGSLVGEGMSLGESEKFAKIIDGVFGTSTPPDYFVANDEDNSEESIKHFKRFKAYVSLLNNFGYTEDEVKKFCERIRDDCPDGLFKFRTHSNLDWRYWMEGILAFMEGQRTYEQLVAVFKKTNLVNKSLTEATKNDIIIFIRSLIRLRWAANGE